MSESKAQINSAFDDLMPLTELSPNPLDISTQSLAERDTPVHLGQVTASQTRVTQRERNPSFRAPTYNHLGAIEEETPAAAGSDYHGDDASLMDSFKSRLESIVSTWPRALSGQWVPYRASFGDDQVPMVEIHVRDHVVPTEKIFQSLVVFNDNSASGKQWSVSVLILWTLILTCNMAIDGALGHVLQPIMHTSVSLAMLFGSALLVQWATLPLVWHWLNKALRRRIMKDTEERIRPSTPPPVKGTSPFITLVGKNMEVATLMSGIVAMLLCVTAFLVEPGNWGLLVFLLRLVSGIFQGLANAWFIATLVVILQREWQRHPHEVNTKRTFEQFLSRQTWSVTFRFGLLPWIVASGIANATVLVTRYIFPVHYIGFSFGFVGLLAIFGAVTLLLLRCFSPDEMSIETVQLWRLNEITSSLPQRFERLQIELDHEASGFNKTMRRLKGSFSASTTVPLFAAVSFMAFAWNFASWWLPVWIQQHFNADLHITSIALPAAATLVAFAMAYPLRCRSYHDHLMQAQLSQSIQAVGLLGLLFAVHVVPNGGNDYFTLGALALVVIGTFSVMQHFLTGLVTRSVLKQSEDCAPVVAEEPPAPKTLTSDSVPANFEVTALETYRKSSLWSYRILLVFAMWFTAVFYTGAGLSFLFEYGSGQWTVERSHKMSSLVSFWFGSHVPNVSETESFWFPPARNGTRDGLIRQLGVVPTTSVMPGSTAQKLVAPITPDSAAEIVIKNDALPLATILVCSALATAFLMLWSRLISRQQSKRTDIV